MRHKSRARALASLPREAATCYSFLPYCVTPPQCAVEYLSRNVRIIGGVCAAKPWLRECML
eukprot:4074386-Pleurochrysis_carterae.AAC.1